MIKDLLCHKLLVLAAMVITSGLFAHYLLHQVLPYHLSVQDEFSANDFNGEYDYDQQQGEFIGKQVSSVPDEAVGTKQVLGLTDHALSPAELDDSGSSLNKLIEVDLTNQKLYALENGERVAEYDVSTGKWGRTPTGEFTIWTKYRFTKMSGGSKALGTYYYLPNVPYTMYFYNAEIPKNRGYGIHGAYWHSNFGEVMSHGCINMRTRDVEKLYYWAGPDTGGKSSINATADNPGTKIVIYGEAPIE